MKKKIKEVIFRKHLESENQEIRFSDLPKDIREDDIIDIRREESFFNAYNELLVIREREETDEEHAKRIDDNKRNMEELRQRRYETYLKLKSEFEA